METNPRETSVDEFMAMENDGGDGRSDVRYELIWGELVAIPIATVAHGKLVANIFNHAREAGDRKDCFVLTSGCAVEVRSFESVFVPDVYGVCDPVDDQQCRSVTPCFVVDVLSPSTSKYHHHVKRFGYLDVPSINEYVIVDESRMRVQVLHRACGPSALDILDKPDDVLEIPCIDLRIPLAAIYQQVNLPESEVA